MMTVTSGLGPTCGKDMFCAVLPTMVKAREAVVGICDDGRHCQ